MSSPSRPKRIFRALLLTLLLVVVVAAALLVVLTRPVVIENWILPRVAQATGVDIQLQILQFSPFSILECGPGQFREKNGAFDFRFDRLRVEYALRDLLRGDLHFSQVELDSPILHLPPPVAPSPGSPTTARPDDSMVAATPAKTPASPPRLDIRNLVIRNGELKLGLADNQLLQLGSFNLTLPVIRNGETLSIETSLRYQLLVVADVPETLAEGAGQFQGSLRWDDRLQPRGLQGRLSGDLQQPGSQVPPLRLAADVEMDLDLTAKSADLKRLQAVIDLPERPLLELTLSQAVSLSWRTKVPQFGDADLLVILHPLRIEDLPLAGLIPLEGGEGSARGRIQLMGSRQMAEASLQFTLARLKGNPGGVALRDASAAGSVQARLQAKNFVVTDLRLEVSDSGRARLKLQGSGEGEMDLSRGEIDLRELDLDLAALPPAWFEGGVWSGQLSGGGRMKWGSDALQGEVNLRLRGGVDAAGRAFPTPLDARVQLAGNLGSLSFDSVQFRWPEAGGFANTLDAVGSLQLPPDAPPRLQLHFSGESVDLNPWQAFLGGTTASPPVGTPTRPSAKPVSTQPPAPEQNRTLASLTLPELPLEESAFSVKLSRLRFRGLDFRGLNLLLNLHPRRAEVDTLSFQLNGSPFQSNARLNWESDQVTFQAQAALDPLNVAPIVDSFLSGKQGAVTGSLRGKLQLRGEGLAGPALRKSLIGRVEVFFDEGQIRILDPNPKQNAGLVETRKLVRAIVSALAAALGLTPEELMEPPVERIHLVADLNGGNLQLQTFEAHNSEFLVRSSGPIQLKSVLEDSEIGPLPVVLGLNTNLAKRVRVYREDRLKDGFIQLPSFLKVEGRLAEPEMDVSKTVISGLILTGVTERNEIGNEKVQNILEGLGGLLSGEGPPPPRPTPTPAPGAPAAPTPTPNDKPSRTDRALQGLELLRQLRATPQPPPAGNR